MTRTAWYRPHIKLVRVGFYETSSCPTQYYVRDWWDGFYFCDQMTGNRYIGERLFWRGLTEKSK